MKYKERTARGGPLALAIALAIAAPGTAAAQASQSEIDALKAQVEALNRRLAEVEAQQPTVAPGSGQAHAEKASWAEKVKISSDLRYRYEDTSEDGREDRDRQRIRARIGITGQVTDDIVLGARLATGGDDPRSTNQTLGDGFSTKDIGTDLAYADWQAFEGFHVILGKMKNPWVTDPVQYFLDGDLNPEGIALTWGQGPIFANAHWYQLAERSQEDDSSQWGGQVGGALELAGIEFTGALGYQDFIDTQGFNPCFDGECNGNSVNGAGNLLYDYNIFSARLGAGFELVGRPLELFTSYAQNDDAPSGQDTAWSAGVVFGKVSAPGSWETGFVYQEVEKDALYGGYVDSDFGVGETDNEGWVFKAGYGLAKNVALGLTYFDTTAEASTANQVDVEKLQLDLQFKY